MPKPWEQPPLWEKCYLRQHYRTYLRAGKIIGHLGIDPMSFYDEARKLPDYNEHRYRRAMEDLTVYTRREASPPRYELHANAKKTLWIIIGPPPDHPEYVKWWTGRMISVRQMQAEGTVVEFADSPPAPLPCEKPAEEPPKKPARKARPKKAEHAEATAKKPARKKKAG